MRFFVAVCIAVCINLSAFFAGAFIFLIHDKSIDFSVLERRNVGKPTILLDDEGMEWARFARDKREPVLYQDMPAHLIHAFIAAEDHQFFTHSGISWRGIIRSSLVNLYHGKIVQGASTITQQLVKLLLLNAQKTFSRKIKEQCMALLVEHQFSKQQIFEAYVNHVYFGCGIYGVQAASQRFWGKSVADISIDEAAVLAAVVRSPRNYCPLLCPLSAQQRRNIILSSMHTLGYISRDAYETAVQKSVTVIEQAHGSCAPHLKETIRQFLEELYGKDAVYEGGFVVQTTLNQHIQQEAMRVFHARMQELKESMMPEIDGALVTLDVQTGGIKALIGGFDFAISPFNRALQAKRQMGSIFKPLVYAAALAEGKSFADTEIDEPFEWTQGSQVWKPHNYNHEFLGKMTRAYALSHSNNIVAIKTFLSIGAQRVIDVARKCHIAGPFHPYPSLALGCVDTTLDVAAAMFNVFAHDGIYESPHYIKWIKDAWGTKVWRHMACSERAMPAPVVGQVAKVLEHGLSRVKPHFKERWFSDQAISKTGTTNDSRTCWFVGSSPEYTTAVYVGCDDNRSMGKNVYPIRTAFPIWLDLYHAIAQKGLKFRYPHQLREAIIHELTGAPLAHSAHEHAITILVDERT